MSTVEAPKAKMYDWPKIRECYLNEAPRPSYGELAERFNMPIGTVNRVGTDENWPALRLANQEQLARQADAIEIVRRSAEGSSLAAGMGSEVCIEIFAACADVLALLKTENKAARHKADVLNTVSFAAQNAAATCQKLGMFEVPGLMKKAAAGVPGGLDGRGQWDPKLMQQINVTVQTMNAARGPTPELAKAAAATTAATDAISTTDANSQ